MVQKSIKVIKNFRVIFDGLAVLTIWGVIVLAGCHSAKPQQPRVMDEWISQPRLGDDILLKKEYRKNSK